MSLAFLLMIKTSLSTILFCFVSENASLNHSSKYISFDTKWDNIIFHSLVIQASNTHNFKKEKLWLRIHIYNNISLQPFIYLIPTIILYITFFYLRISGRIFYYIFMFIAIEESRNYMVILPDISVFVIAKLFLVT